MMKKISFVFMLVAVCLLTPATYAELPTSSYYNGQHDRSFDLGSDGILDIHLEFAVYRDETSSGGVDEAQILQEWTGHTGDSAYVYAYQIFNEQSSTAALTYFELTGINPTTIASVENDISQQDQLNSTYFSNGVQPAGDGGYFNDSVTKAIWEFENGAIAKGDQSWFLFLYSDYDWIAGDINVVKSTYTDDIPVPDQDNNIPEPTTLALLGCGAILSLKRRK